MGEFAESSMSLQWFSSAKVTLKDNHKPVLELLTKARKNAGSSNKLAALTLNNLACYYRYTGKHRTALSYLEQALALEKQLQNYKNIADIFLNICVVLSSLNKHRDALDAALNAVFLMQEELLNVSLPLLFNSSPLAPEHLQPNKATTKAMREKENRVKANSKGYNVTFSSDREHSGKRSPEEMQHSLERIRVLAIAYHNMGAELEHLRLQTDALKVYEKGYRIAVTYLGEHDEISLDLKQIAKDLRERLIGSGALKASVREQSLGLKNRGESRLVNNDTLDEARPEERMFERAPRPEPLRLQEVSGLYGSNVMQRHEVLSDDEPEFLQAAPPAPPSPDNASLQAPELMSNQSPLSKQLSTKSRAQVSNKLSNKQTSDNEVPMTFKLERPKVQTAEEQKPDENSSKQNIKPNVFDGDPFAVRQFKDKKNTMSSELPDIRKSNTLPNQFRRSNDQPGLNLNPNEKQPPTPRDDPLANTDKVKDPSNRSFNNPQFKINEKRVEANGAEQYQKSKTTKFEHRVSQPRNETVKESFSEARSSITDNHIESRRNEFYSTKNIGEAIKKRDFKITTSDDRIILPSVKNFIQKSILHNQDKIEEITPKSTLVQTQKSNNLEEKSQSAVREDKRNAPVNQPIISFPTKSSQNEKVDSEESINNSNDYSRNDSHHTEQQLKKSGDTEQPNLQTEPDYPWTINKASSHSSDREEQESHQDSYDESPENHQMHLQTGKEATFGASLSDREILNTSQQSEWHNDLTKSYFQEI